MESNALLLLPARARQAIYIAFWALALIVSCTQVGYASVNVPNPTWLTVALAVVAFLAVPIGALAASNVQKHTEP